MDRRSFFRLVGGSAAWLATRHVAWAFPEPSHVIPQRMVYGRIRISREVLFADNVGAFARAAQDEYNGLISDLLHLEERAMGVRKAW